MSRYTYHLTCEEECFPDNLEEEARLIFLCGKHISYSDCYWYFWDTARYASLDSENDVRCEACFKHPRFQMFLLKNVDI